jgi:hypothetical protein
MAIETSGRDQIITARWWIYTFPDRAIMPLHVMHANRQRRRVVVGFVASTSAQQRGTAFTPTATQPLLVPGPIRVTSVTVAASTV